MHLSLATLLALPVLGFASQHHGCYSQIQGIKSVVSFHFQSQGYCLSYCNKDAYAVLTGGLECLCTDIAPSESTKIDDAKCDLSCSGFPSDKCGGHDSYTFLTSTGQSSSSDSILLSDVDSLSGSSSNSDPTSTSDSSASASAVTAASTAGGGIVIAANPSTMPTSMATSASSNANAKATPITKVANAATTTTAADSSASSASPSPSTNAADTLRVGPAAGIVLAGLGLLL